MKIILNPDVEHVNLIKEKLKDNAGFCPCRLEKTPENKCMCREFKTQESGMCHCGLYIKIQEEENAN